MFATAAFEAYRLPTAAPRALGSHCAQAPRRLPYAVTEYRFAGGGQSLYHPQSAYHLPALASPSLKTRLEPRDAAPFRSQEPLAAFGPKISLYKELTAKYGLVLKPRAPNSLPRLSVAGRQEEFQPYQPAGFARRGDLFSGRGSSPESSQTACGWPRSEPPSSTMRSAALYSARRWPPVAASDVGSQDRHPAAPQAKLSAPEPLRRVQAQRPVAEARLFRPVAERKLEAAELLSVHSDASLQLAGLQAALRAAESSAEPVRPYCAPRRIFADAAPKFSALPDEQRTASTAEPPAKPAAAEAPPRPPIFSSQRFIPFRSAPVGGERPGHARSRSFARETPGRESGPRKGESGPESRQDAPDSITQTPALPDRDSPTESPLSSAAPPAGSERAESPPSLLLEQSRSCEAGDLSFGDGAPGGPASPLRGDDRVVAELSAKGCGHYVGESRAGQMDGLGRLYDAQGDLVYEGWFSANRFEGLGTLTLRGSRAAETPQPWDDLASRAEAMVRYEGEFLGNAFSGQGVAEYAGGELFFGEFSNGLPDGHGVWTNGEKTTCGVWAAGAFVDGV